MSKVYEDGIERNPTADEQVDINRPGGGTSRFEVVASGTITNTNRESITFSGYDELYVVMDNLTGSGNLVMQIQVESTTTTTRLNNFLTSTAKYVKNIIQRISEIDFLTIYNATSVNTALVLTPLATPDGITYDNKIVKLVIGSTGTDSIIASGNYKIYGRNLISNKE